MGLAQENKCFAFALVHAKLHGSGANILRILVLLVEVTRRRYLLLCYKDVGTSSSSGDGTERARVKVDQ